MAHLFTQISLKIDLSLTFVSQLRGSYPRLYLSMSPRLISMGECRYIPCIQLVLAIHVAAHKHRNILQRIGLAF